MKYLKHTNSYISSSILMALTSCLWTNAARAQPAIQIENQAAGTYADPQVKSEPINVLSNTVAITVQEVSGINITPSGIPIERADGGTVDSTTVNDLLFYNFNIQNTGNDTTKIFVPNLAQVNGLGSFQKAQYFDGGTWQDIPATGYTSNSITPNGKLQIRIVVKVTGSNGTLSVTIGKAANPNQPRINNPEDIYTIDNDNNVVGEIDGTPANGVSEAQATQELNIGQAPEALTVAKLSNKPFNATDSTVEFDMSLEVLDKAPSGINNVAPTDLTGRKTSIDNAEQTGVLLTDAVPLGTELVSATTPSSDWIKIYDYSSSPISAIDRPDTVNWSTNPPNTTTTANIRRVGFFRPNTRIPKGTTISGFGIKVRVINPAQTTEIYNIAQVIGSTPANPSSASDNTPSQRIVYEESGDRLPNNYNSDGSKAVVDSNQQPLIDPGIIDSTVADNDPRSPKLVGEDLGNNSQNSALGEYLMVSINTPSSIKNGPKGQPGAIATTNNDDFTNKSTPLTKDNTATGKFDPSALSFTNTIANNGNQPQTIKIVPRVALTNDLPNGTIVTLSDPNNSSTTAAFTYADGIFTPKANSPIALVLSQVAANSNKDYTVTIDLPAQTSTISAFPLKLVAFIDTDANNAPGDTEEQNTTIDRTYTGVMQVVKESRVLNSDKTPVGDGAFSTIAKAVASKQFIEYRITYTNISAPSPSNGNGNKTVNATNFILTEDGRASPNNWADSTTNDPNSATNIGTTGSITYDTATGTGSTTDPTVIKYTTKIANSISPSGTGTFTFRRQVR
jgi:hypothetical protein